MFQADGTACAKTLRQEGPRYFSVINYKMAVMRSAASGAKVRIKVRRQSTQYK